MSLRPLSIHLDEIIKMVTPEKTVENLKAKLWNMQENKKHDIVFLVDGSGSVTLPYFVFELKFVRTVLNGFNVNPDFTQIAVVQFSDTTVRVYVFKQ